MGIIRLLLALSVVAAHCGPIFGLTMVGGKVAVQSFYIISGFYMSIILNEKYIGKNKSYTLFITNRCMRLFPIYWAILIGTIGTSVVIALLTKGFSFPVFESYLAVKTNVMSFMYLVFTNLFIIGQDIVLFLGIHSDTGILYFTSNYANSTPQLHTFLFIPQAWTLGIELSFYLIAPFILTRGYKPVLALLICSFALRIFFYNYLGLKEDPWNYRFFPTEIFFFLLGYVSYQIYLKYKNIEIGSLINISFLIICVLFTLLYSYISAFKLKYLPFSIKEILYFTIITLLMPLLFNYFKNNKLDNKIGELSYPVYISHMLILMIFSLLHLSFFKMGWVIAFATIIASFILNKFIALPIEKYRQARIKN